mgnify:CR=1 FL=1
MLDIHWLKTFVTLAEHKHFGKAATALHMTQPNVSLHIKQLEQSTRVKLIDRNPFRLTQAGFRLLESSQKTLMELQISQIMTLCLLLTMLSKLEQRLRLKHELIICRLDLDILQETFLQI